MPLKPSQSNDKDIEFEGEIHDIESAEFGFDEHKTKPGTTIIKNIGKKYFGIPPGVAVRAHVQSIDLYPFGPKPISPSEAIENEQN